MYSSLTSSRYFTHQWTIISMSSENTNTPVISAFGEKILARFVTYQHFKLSVGLTGFVG